VAEPPPRIEVDFNRWGMHAGHGRAFLAYPDATSADGVAVRPGLTVTVFDPNDADEDGRPADLEVEAVVGWSPYWGWFGEYLSAEMTSVTRDQ